MSLLNNSQSDAKRYQASAEDLSYRELRFAGWYIRNKTKVANVGIGVLLAWCIITVGYSLIMWVGYLAIGMQQDARMVEASLRQFQDYRLLQPQFAPTPLVVGSTESRVENDDKKSYVTEVRNPNIQWIATVTYRYPASETSPVYTQVVLPGARSVLADLGASNSSQTARLEILDVNWQRLSPHDVPDPTSFIAARLRQQISDITIESYDAVQETPARVSFTITNDSAYGYWEATYMVLMYSGDRISVARPLILNQFEPGSSKQVEFNFGRERLGITDIEVLPNINVFDQDLYLPVTSFSL
jgi:hypothetical protein